VQRRANARIPLRFVWRKSEFERFPLGNHATLRFSGTRPATTLPASSTFARTFSKRSTRDPANSKPERASVTLRQSGYGRFEFALTKINLVCNLRIKLSQFLCVERSKKNYMRR
jgi:hypothetical protein